MFSKSLKAILGKNKSKPPASQFDNPRVSSFELKLPAADSFKTGDRLTLYRFLADNIPILNGAIWLWAKLCAAPVEFKFSRLSETQSTELIHQLDRSLSPSPYQKSGGIETLVNLFFRSLFLDGCFGGEAVLNISRTGLAKFAPCDNRFLTFEQKTGDW